MIPDARLGQREGMSLDGAIDGHRFEVKGQAGDAALSS
jgi:hypothetical protein